MEFTSSNDGSASRLAARCRRTVSAADRGWKATALGVAIVTGAALLP